MKHSRDDLACGLSSEVYHRFITETCPKPQNNEQLCHKTCARMANPLETSLLLCACLLGSRVLGYNICLTSLRTVQGISPES